MAVRTKTQFKALYGTTGTLFPDNTTQEISEADVRAFGEDIADSFVDETDNLTLTEVLTEGNNAGALQIKNIADGSDPQDAVSKAQLDAAALGIVTSWKAPVKVSTTVAGTLASDFENGDTIDGVALVTGDRILIKNQAAATENGIYTVNASGDPTRASDANVAAELEGAAVTVQQGTSNANTTWIQTTDAINLGVSNIVFAQLGTSVPDADATTKGIAKLYTGTGSNTDGSMDQNSITNAITAALSAAKSLVIAVTDEVSNIAAGTAQVTFRMPYAMTLTAVRASLKVAQASGSIFTVDINEAGTTILSTKLTIDNTATTSVGAATPAVISDTALADDAVITIDVDQIGNGSAIGLKITLIGT